MQTIAAPLKGKIAIITGASRGIGAATARKFAELGCTHIAITYHSNQAAAEKTLLAVREINSEIQTCSIQGDCIDPDFGPKVVKAALSGLKTDRIDIMVSNAAFVDVTLMPPVADMTKKHWDEMLTAEAWAPLSLSREVVAHMPRGGRIIMISSTASKSAVGDPVVSYAAGKAAMEAVSKNLATQWGVSKGITVNTISVGATKTDSSARLVELVGSEAEAAFANASLLRRFGEPQEVADIVAFVASPQAGWIIGNQIPANGGALAQLQG